MQAAGIPTFPCKTGSYEGDTGPALWEIASLCDPFGVTLVTAQQANMTEGGEANSGMPSLHKTWTISTVGFLFQHLSGPP